jgi:hypothetical protein
MLTSSHQDGRHHHEHANVALRIAEKRKNNASASYDWEAKSKISDTNRQWIVTVNIVTLCWPEHEDGEEVRARNEGDNERK